MGKLEAKCSSPKENLTVSIQSKSLYSHWYLSPSHPWVIVNGSSHPSFLCHILQTFRCVTISRMLPLKSIPSLCDQWFSFTLPYEIFNIAKSKTSATPSSPDFPALLLPSHKQSWTSHGKVPSLLHFLFCQKCSHQSSQWPPGSLIFLSISLASSTRSHFFPRWASTALLWPAFSHLLSPALLSV